MDFITDLPEIDSYDTILSVVDHSLTKGVILIPTKKTVTTEEMAQLILENVHKQFGLPDKIISDCGPQFTSNFWRAIFEATRIKLYFSIAYHPQTDGQTK